MRYIEMAWTGARVGIAGVIDGLRSPLYPFLLSVVFRLFRPAPLAESTLVQVLNLVIYFVDVACFEIFVRELLHQYDPPPPAAIRRARLPSQAVWVLAYVFFLWAYLEWLRPYQLTPDLCVAACVYLATTILLRLHRGDGGWMAYVLLGLTLGVAYLAQAFMFLVGWVFLFCCAWAGGLPRRAWPKSAAAVLGFLLIAGPQILALSHLEGHWTFSDSGTLNYAWYIDRIPPMYWQGGPPSAGYPIHPPRQLMSRPAVYEFPVSAQGEFHSAGDVAYWYQGVRPYFQLRDQLRVIGQSLGIYVQMLSRTGALYLALLILLLLVRGSGSWGFATLLRQWSIWAPAGAAFAVCALVHVEPRYVGAFALTFLMGLFAAAEPAEARLKPWLRRATLGMISLAAAVVLVSAAESVIAIAAPKPSEPFAVAQAIDSLQIFPPSPVHAVRSAVPRGYAATIGSFPAPYWANLDELRIVATVPSAEEFWRASPQMQSQVMSKLAASGVQVVVAQAPRLSDHVAGDWAGDLNGWQRVPGTAIYIYYFLAGSRGSINARDPRAASAGPSSSRDTSR